MVTGKENNKEIVKESSNQHMLKEEIIAMHEQDTWKLTSIRKLNQSILRMENKEKLMQSIIKSLDSLVKCVQ